MTDRQFLSTEELRRKDIRHDLRQFGVIVVAAGLVAFFLPQSQLVSSENALILALAGGAGWAVASLTRPDRPAPHGEKSATFKTSFPFFPENLPCHRSSTSRL